MIPYFSYSFHRPDVPADSDVLQADTQPVGTKKIPTFDYKRLRKSRSRRRWVRTCVSGNTLNVRSARVEDNILSP